MGIRRPRQRGPDTSFRLSYRGRRAKSSQNCDRLSRAAVDAIKHGKPLRIGGHNLGQDPVPGRSLRGSNQPMWPMLLDPIENAGSDRAQQTHIVCEECESDREHPEPYDRQGAKNPAEHQQDPQWNSQPPTGRLPDEANRRAQPPGQAIYESIEAPVVGCCCHRASFRRNRKVVGQRSHLLTS